MGDVFEFPKGSRVKREDDPKRQHENRVRREGALSIDNLHRKGKLNNQDREVLARNLHNELEQSGFTKTALAVEAEITLKDLYRLVLPEGSDRWVTGNNRRYEGVIRALSKLTRTNVNALADKLLKGTSRHPSQVQNHTDTQRLQLAIQGLVDQTDSQYDLHQKCSLVAAQKAKVNRPGFVGGSNT